MSCNKKQNTVPLIERIVVRQKVYIVLVGDGVLGIGACRTATQPHTCSRLHVRIE
jgi:hypothetical protein